MSVGSMLSSASSCHIRSTPSAVERRARAVAERARDGHAQPHVVAPRERAGQLEREHLRAGQRRPEARAVDRHRQLADRQPGGGERARERDRLRRRRLQHRLGVVRVAAVELLLVGAPGARLRAPPNEPRAAVEDVEVVGDHVAQPAREAALAEVDLLAVAGRERLVEARRPARAPSGGCRGSARRRSGCAGAAAARRARSAGRPRRRSAPAAARGDGCFQSGTERIVPWLVSVLAVATSPSL